MEKRVKNIFSCLEKKPDIILIKNSIEPYIDDNFFYVTSLEKGIFEGSIAVLHRDGCIDVLVSELEAETAKKADVNLFIYNFRNSVFEYEYLARNSYKYIMLDRKIRNKSLKAVSMMEKNWSNRIAKLSGTNLALFNLE